MTRPVTPGEVVRLKQEQIPESVIEAFNGLIADHFDGRQSVVSLREAYGAVTRLTGKSKDEILRSGWMDVEPLYRAAGWSVIYDQPGWNESGEGTYTFSLGGP